VELVASYQVDVTSGGDGIRSCRNIFEVELRRGEWLWGPVGSEIADEVQIRFSVSSM